MSIEIDQHGELLLKLLGRYGASTRFIEGFNHWIEVLLRRDVEQMDTLYIDNNSYLKIRNPISYYPKIFVDAPQGRDLLPAECRIKKLSFTSVLTIDLVLYTKKLGRGGTEYEETAVHRYPAGAFPAMVLSHLDPNERKTPTERFQAGEPEIDTGGYFIIDGRELILQNVVHLIPHEPIVIFDEKLHKAHVRYTSKTPSDTTVNIVMEDSTAKYNIIFSQINKQLSMKDGNSINIFLAFFCLGFAERNSSTQTEQLIKSFIDDPRLQTDISFMLESTKQEFIRNSTPTTKDIDNAIAELGINDPRHPDVYKTARYYRISNYLKKSFEGVKPSEVSLSGTTSGRRQLKEQLIIMINEVKINLLKNIEYKPSMPDEEKSAALSRKRRTLASIVLQLMYNKLGIVPVTDRDDWQFKMIETAAMHMRNKMNEILRYQLEEMQRKINSTKTQDIKVIAGAVNKDYMLNTFTDAFRTNSWKRGKSETSIVLPLSDPNSNNLLSRQVNVSRVIVPASKQVVQKKRLIPPSSDGIMCPVFTPEGAPCGLVGEPSIGLHISVERDPNNIYWLMQSVVSPEIITIGYSDGGQSVRNKAFYINGEHHGFCDPYETKEYFDALRRATGIPQEERIPVDVGIVLDQFEEIHIRTTAGRPMIPYLIVDRASQKLIIDIKGLWQADISTLFLEGCIEYIDVGESVSPITLIADDPIKLTEKREYMAKTDANLKLDPNNESFKRAYEAANEQDMYTHCFIDPTARFGLSVLTIAGFNMSPPARATYGSGMAKQALITNFMRADYRFEAAKTIHYAGAPLVTTQTNVNLGFDRYPSGRNVIVAVMPYGGANQEDGTIWNQSALERGLFTYTLYHVFEVKIIKSTMIEEFRKPEIKETDRKKQEIYSKIDPNTGLVRAGSYVRVGDCLVSKFSRNPTSNQEPKHTPLLMGVGKEGIVDEVYSRELPGGGRIIQIRVRQTMIPRVGDKMTSRISQKGVITQTLKQYEMPYIVSPDPRLNGVVPHVIFNTHGYPSRMTMTQPAEMVIGLKALYQAKRQNLTPFKHYDPFALLDELRGYGFNEKVKVQMYDGISGRKMDGLVSVGPVYYQALPHLAVLKREGISTGAVDPVTRQPLRGVRTGNALRIGSMEEQAFLAHGGAHLVQERLSRASDSFEFVLCNKCGIIVSPEGPESKYMCRLCGTTDKGKFVKVRVSYIVKVAIYLVAAVTYFIRLFALPPASARVS